MESLYQDSRRLLGETELLVQQVVTAPSEASEARLAENLDQLSTDLSRLQLLARKELPSRRQEANMRVEQLRVEVSNLDRAYSKHRGRLAEMAKEATEREELLTRRYTSTAPGPHPPMDHALQLENDLSHSNAELDRLLSHGDTILGGLRDQRSLYKTAQRKLLDLTSTLGLSNTVMRIIERRTSQDMYIFWIGLALTVTVIILLIYYFVL